MDKSPVDSLKLKAVENKYKEKLSIKEIEKISLQLYRLKEIAEQNRVHRVYPDPDLFAEECREIDTLGHQLRSDLNWVYGLLYRLNRFVGRPFMWLMKNFFKVCMLLFIFFLFWIIFER